ncbi:MAG TPA: PQQ-binding-like beta-propeller repeat protein, partial [Chloroflexota bacterium]|nr:PQQ-binding-like beta-propeller repeat protein [Chloroflexota bacterium]
MRVPWRRLAQLVLIVALLAAYRPARAAPDAASGNVDWPRIGNTTDQHHYSPLDQITTANVGRLRLAWSLPEGSHLTLFEDTPVVVAGIIYLTTNTGQVIAARADTGRRLWTYTPTVDFLHQLMSGDLVQPVNRGVEVANGHVYLATYDDQLISLNAATGKPEWRVVVANPDQYYEQSPPTYWNGLLFLGEAGIGPGVRGFVAAFDARTGRLCWRFHTVPAPGHGWMASNGQTGGGDVWMPVTVDPRTGIVYAGTGNPTPALVNRARPGCDRWTDATLAIDGRT